MVRIAIAGGSGQVAREVIDALLVEDKHEITVLSRNGNPTDNVYPTIDWRIVNYCDHQDLVEALQGVHTVLSFLQLLSDPESTTQKRLIDAAIAAGAQRFAPSEFGSAATVHMRWWVGKESTREYLQKINGDSKVLEYTLFQPGLFLDYLAFPYKTATHIDPLQSVFDLQHCRVIMVEGQENAIMTLTSASDVAAMVVRAVGYGGEWPKISGIRGNRMTFAEVVEIGKSIRGCPFTIDKVKLEDLEAGNLNTSWSLEKRHQAVAEQQDTDFADKVTIGILLSSVNGAWDVSDELNQLFPDYKFDKVEDFLSRVWSDKP